MHLFNLSESSVNVCISLSFAFLMLTHPPNLHNSSRHPQISLDMNASQQREIELLDIINSVRLKLAIMSNVLFKEMFLVCLFVLPYFIGRFLLLIFLLVFLAENKPDDEDDE